MTQPSKAAEKAADEIIDRAETPYEGCGISAIAAADIIDSAMKPERKAAEALKNKLMLKYDLSIFRGQPEIEILDLIKAYETARGEK